MISSHVESQKSNTSQQTPINMTSLHAHQLKLDKYMKGSANAAANRYG